MLACWQFLLRRRRPPPCNNQILPTLPLNHASITTFNRKQTLTCNNHSPPIPPSNQENIDTLEEEQTSPRNNQSPPTQPSNHLNINSLIEEQSSPCNNQSPSTPLTNQSLINLTIEKELIYPDWSRIPGEIWSLILQKLPLEDYIRSAIVCSDWLSIVRPLKDCNSQPRVPWLMVPQYHDTTRWKLFDIANKNKPLCTIHLPELENSTILGSSDGWLVVVDNTTANMGLFNPFTKAHIKLPPAVTLPGVVGADHDWQGKIMKYHTMNRTELWEANPWIFSKCYIRAAFLGSSNCGYTVIVTEISGCNTAFARIGDKAWTSLPTPGVDLHRWVRQCTFFNGVFYITGIIDGAVFSLDFNNSYVSPPLPLLVAPPSLFTLGRKHLLLLPESDEILMSIVTFTYSHVTNIFKLDKNIRKWVEVSSLYGHSMFLTQGIIGLDHGTGSMMCLSPKDHPAELQGNYMYIIADKSLIVGDLNKKAISGGSLDVWDIKSHPLDNKAAYFLDDIPVWINPVLTSLL